MIVCSATIDAQAFLDFFLGKSAKEGAQSAIETTQQQEPPQKKRKSRWDQPLKSKISPGDKGRSSGSRKADWVLMDAAVTLDAGLRVATTLTRLSWESYAWRFSGNLKVS